MPCVLRLVAHIPIYRDPVGHFSIHTEGHGWRMQTFVAYSLDYCLLFSTSYREILMLSDEPGVQPALGSLDFSILNPNMDG
jgi:hypothetical protein